MAEMIDREFLNSENRIWLENDAGEEIAFISFPYVGSGRKLVCIDHTVVDPSLQGQGIASRLVREAVEEGAISRERYASYVTQIEEMRAKVPYL